MPKKLSNDVKVDKPKDSNYHKVGNDKIIQIMKHCDKKFSVSCKNLKKCQLLKKVKELQECYSGAYSAYRQMLGSLEILENNIENRDEKFKKFKQDKKVGFFGIISRLTAQDQADYLKMKSENKYLKDSSKRWKELTKSLGKFFSGDKEQTKICKDIIGLLDKLKGNDDLQGKEKLLKDERTLLKLEWTDNDEKEVTGLKAFIEKLKEFYTIADTKEDTLEINCARDYMLSKLKAINELLDNTYKSYRTNSLYTDILCGNFPNEMSVSEEIKNEWKNKAQKDKEEIAKELFFSLVPSEASQHFNNRISLLQKEDRLCIIVTDLQSIAIYCNRLKINDSNSSGIGWVMDVFGLSNNIEFSKNILKNLKDLDPNTRWNKFKNFLTNMTQRTESQIQLKKDIMSLYDYFTKSYCISLEQFDAGKIFSDKSSKILQDMEAKGKEFEKKLSNFSKEYSNYVKTTNEKIPSEWRSNINTRWHALYVAVKEVYNKFKQNILKAENEFLNGKFGTDEGNGFSGRDCVFCQECKESSGSIGQIFMCICIKEKEKLKVNIIPGIFSKIGIENLASIDIGKNIPTAKFLCGDSTKIKVRRVQQACISLKNKIFSLNSDLKIDAYVLFQSKVLNLLSKIFPENVANFANGAGEFVGLKVDVGNLTVLQPKNSKK